MKYSYHEIIVSPALTWQICATLATFLLFGGIATGVFLFVLALLNLTFCGK